MDNLFQTALENLDKNKATSEEMELLRSAVVSGQISIDGDVNNSVIIIGSGNTVIRFELSSDALEQLASVNYLSALHELRQPPADFVGRNKELKKILSNIEKKSGATISGLIGMAGIGKTALGLVVAHSLVSKYPDAQFFIDLRGTSNNPLSPIDVMKQVVQSFHPTADLRNATEEELSGSYQSSLAKKKTILFLDNAHDASQVMPLRPSSNSLMVVTSRFHFTIPGLHSVELNVLNKSESVKLLKEICPRLTRKDAQRIAELCGNLPIALRLAGSYLRIHVDWSIHEYISDLADKAKRLQSLDLEGADINVIASFEQSYQQLSDEEKRYWSMLSIFPVSFKRDALASAWNLDDSLARKLAGKLYQYSLLEYDSFTNRYRLHDLLATFASTKLAEAEREVAFLYYLMHYRDIWFKSEILYTMGGDNLTRGFLQFDAEYLHIETAYKWAMENPSADTNIHSLISQIPESIYVFRTRVHPKKQILWFTNALRSAQMVDDLDNQSKLLGNIGATYFSLGENIRSIEYYEKALEISCKVENKQRQGFWLGNIGSVYIRLGENQKAIWYLEQALKIAREIGDSQRQGFWLGNMGVVYSNISEYEKELACYEEALVVAREMNDIHRQCSWLGNIGAAYRHLGENQKAIEYLEQALNIAISIGDRQRQSGWLGNIGLSYLELGENQKAIEYLKQALEIAREMGDQQREGFWLGSIGVIYGYLGDNHKAIGTIHQALEIARKVKDKLSECEWLNQLGDLCISMRQLDVAAQNLEIALAIAKELGSRNMEGKVFLNFAKLAQLSQDKNQALKYANDARKLFVSTKSPELKKADQFIESLNQTP